MSIRAKTSGSKGRAISRWEKVRPLPSVKPRWLAVGLLFMACLWVGCTKAYIGEVRKAPSGFEPHEAVAILVSRDSRIAQDEIVGCIRTALNERHPTLRIVPPDKFRRTAFPDLAPEAAPHSPEYLSLLLMHPVFLKRIAPLGIRYLISVSGGTEQNVTISELGALGGPHAAVPLYIWAADRQTRLVASILDLTQTRAAGEVRTEVSGCPWFAIIGIFPLGLPAFTESRACGELGEGIAKFLAGQSPPEP